MDSLCLDVLAEGGKEMTNEQLIKVLIRLL